MKVLAAVKRANRPGPPEHSVRLRVLVTGAGATGILACRAEGELTTAMAVFSLALLATGMVFSHRTRLHPVPAVKPLLAAAALVAFGWFFVELRGEAFSDISGVEGLLAGLFVWIQVTHSFDVPARRDLAFSLAGATGLMAVAGAQATDMTFGLYVVTWGAWCIAALFAMWRSAGGGAPVGRGAGATVGAVLSVGLVAFLLLPAPQVGGNIGVPASLGAAVGVTNPGGLAGDGPHPGEPARPGTPSGRTRVGGFLGFADHLDTAVRGDAGDTLVMRVRAQRPGYWVGETFDTWDGANWLARKTVPEPIVSGSPFLLPAPQGAAVGGGEDLQTFYVVAPNPNLVFHADTARELWFPASTIFVQPDGTILSPVALGRGTVYTVESATATPSPDQLRTASGVDLGLDAAQRQEVLQLPHPYPRVQALAQAVTASAPTTYDKVQALIAWIASHTRYSTDIPPLPPGADTVDQFLFTERVGFCEQISTSLAVMLRSIGIPAREAVGYVPGPYNPLTDLYDVQARDAHAWVQVWFPTYGWQSFDPTASVPLANPSPGSAVLRDTGHVLGALGVGPIAAGLVGVGAAVAGVRALRRRPRGFAHRAARNMERAGRRAGRARREDETLREYASRLDAAGPGGAPGDWTWVAQEVEREAYGALALTDGDRRRVLRLSATLRVPRAQRTRV